MSQQSLKYPTYDSKQWGPPYWFNFHENASLYPDNPSKEDIEQERQHIRYFVTHLPCKATCEPKAKKFLEENPPNLNNRKEYFGWTIRFHNEINKENGDEERYENPEELLDEHGCNECKLPSNTNATNSNVNVEKTIVSHDSDHKFKTSLGEYKNAIRTLIKATYEKEGIEAPEIAFNKCPDGTDTSCAIVLKNADGTRKHMTFYRPEDLVSTIFHEVDHHVDLSNGKSIDDSLNPKANKYASDMISKYFPLDNIAVDKNGKYQVAHDIIIKGESMPIPKSGVNRDPATVVSDIYGQPNQFSDSAEDPNILNDFPHLKQTLMEIKKEELKNEIREYEGKGGVLTHFDRIYAWPAEMTGLKPEQLNLLHTPTIISNVAGTLAATFLSPLTSTLVTVVFGIFLMILGVGFHKRMTTRDIQLVQAIGSQLMWGNAIPSLNPKKARKIKDDFDRFTDKISNHDFHARDLIETPGNDESGFKPKLEHPDFGRMEKAFAGKHGRPIRQGRLKHDNYDLAHDRSRGGGSSMRSDAVIRLPPYSSISHSRFV